MVVVVEVLSLTPPSTPSVVVVEEVACVSVELAVSILEFFVMEEAAVGFDVEDVAGLEDSKSSNFITMSPRQHS